jgi:hypothetical protein
MVKRKLVIIQGQPYWGNKEIPKEKKKGVIMKGLSLVGQGAKIVGKEIGKAARNYGEQQRQEQKKPQHKEKPQKKDDSFFSSGF